MKLTDSLAALQQYSGGHLLAESTCDPQLGLTGIA